jgi:Cof subfamily protein (haloacid dehalogenase superfamily)
MKRIVFLDVDGTLIEPVIGMHHPHPSTLEALHRLQAKGIKVCAATGRELHSIRHVIDFPFDACVTANGSIVYADDRVIFQGGFTPEEAVYLWDTLVELGAGFVFQGGTAYYYKDTTDPFVARYVERMQARGEKLFQTTPQAIPVAVTKSTTFFHTQAMKEAAIERLAMRYRMMFYNAPVRVGQDNRLSGDISNIRDTKGSGIQHVLAHYRFDPLEGIAFGDNSNDIDMFEVLEGYAVANATDDLKAHAREVIGDVQTDAIAQTLMKLQMI